MTATDSRNLGAPRAVQGHVDDDSATPAEGEALQIGLARLQPRLQRHLASPGRRVRGLDPADVAQEVNARALRYAKSFATGSALWPWLARVAERVVRDHRARRAGVAHDPADVETAADGRRDPREDVDARDALAHGLAALDEHERHVLLEFHQQGRSVREIARSLGCPEGTVKSRLHRARRRLAELLEGERPDA